MLFTPICTYMSAVYPTAFCYDLVVWGADFPGFDFRVVSVVCEGKRDDLEVPHPNRIMDAHRMVVNETVAMKLRDLLRFIRANDFKCITNKEHPLFMEKPLKYCWIEAITAVDWNLYNVHLQVSISNVVFIIGIGIYQKYIS